MIWFETTFSKILEKNESLEMGLKWLRTRGSKEGFFSRGCIWARLKSEGKTPVDREQFKMDRIWGPTVSMTSFRKLVGMAQETLAVEH